MAAKGQHPNGYAASGQPKYQVCLSGAFYPAEFRCATDERPTPTSHCYIKSRVTACRDPTNSKHEKLRKAALLPSSRFLAVDKIDRAGIIDALWGEVRTHFFKLAHRFDDLEYVTRMHGLHRAACLAIPALKQMQK